MTRPAILPGVPLHTLAAVAEAQTAACAAMHLATGERVHADAARCWAEFREIINTLRGEDWE